MLAITLSVNTGRLVEFGPSESASHADKAGYRLDSEIANLPKPDKLAAAKKKQAKISKRLMETFELEDEKLDLEEQEKQKKLSAEIDKKRSRLIDFSFGTKKEPEAQKPKPAEGEEGAEEEEEETPAEDTEESEDAGDDAEPAEEETEE
jgi:hypothetical protein